MSNYPYTLFLPTIFMLLLGFICSKRRPGPGRMGSGQGREGYSLGSGRPSGLSRAETHHCAVKSTNSGEKRSAGSWGTAPLPPASAAGRGSPRTRKEIAEWPSRSAVEIALLGQRHPRSHTEAKPPKILPVLVQQPELDCEAG